MYISLNWLKEFVKIPQKISVNEIAVGLTQHTVEVEGLAHQADKFKNIVIGRVLEINKHPNADRLRVALVDIKKNKLKIVCGAPNLAEGQLVPVALVGAILPGGLEIKESEIRGEKSSGMICAEDELGIGKGHEGILVLNNNAVVGGTFSKYLKASDVILEIDNKSLSNRPDLLSHYGIAREIGAIFDLTVKPYEKLLNKKIEFLDPKDSELEVKIEDKEDCARYMAVKISGLEVKESPDWLKEKLIAINQKPINNLVDLTNYVMFECGQPLHAFSADGLKRIVVRRAQKNESLETLDEKERVLDESDLVISDGQSPIALAGIMGGKNSGINETTKSIVLESANFKATLIRKTSQKLGLRSEASARFEKSLDQSLTESALFRYINLLSKICPALKISSSLIDVQQVVLSDKSIVLDLDWLDKKIGQEIPKEESIKILKSLGFKIEEQTARQLAVMIPSWRATKDVTAREDLAEEVLRIYGYDKIISRMPIETLSLPEINQERMLERKIKNILSLKYCLSEMYNYSFVGEEQLKKLNIDFSNYLKLVNPLSGIQNILRQSLVPHLISNIKINQAKSEKIGFFEIGDVFFGAPGSIKKGVNNEETLPYQEKKIGLILASEETDLFIQLKGIVDNLLKNLINYEIQTEFLLSNDFPGWADKNQIVKIRVLNKELGTIAVVNGEASNNISLKKKVVIAEINFNALAELIFSLTVTRFREIEKYPAVVRDLAFVLNEKILYNEIRNEIVKFNPLIRSVELFDIYVGSQINDNEKSLAFHLSLQAEDRTLTASEVEIIITALIKHISERFEARIRN